MSEYVISVNSTVDLPKNSLRKSCSGDSVKIYVGNETYDDICQVLRQRNFSKKS